MLRVPAAEIDWAELDLYNVIDAEENSMQWQMGLSLQYRIRFESIRFDWAQFS